MIESSLASELRRRALNHGDFSISCLLSRAADALEDTKSEGFKQGVDAAIEIVEGYISRLSGDYIRSDKVYQMKVRYINLRKELEQLNDNRHEL